MDDSSTGRRVGKYLLGEVLGTGATGVVKYALNTETGEKVAVKIIDQNKLKLKSGLVAQVEREIVALKHLTCENIVQLKGVLRSSQHIWIVMECLGGGSLLDCLMNYGRLDEHQSRNYIKQIVSGIEFCHTHNIYHRDLKPDNILLSADLLTAKVADFGLATLVEKDSQEWKNSRCGSAQYAAPELFVTDCNYLPGPVDIWGIGLLLYIMAAGFPPFQDRTTTTLIQKIAAAAVKFPPWFSAPLKDLIRKILTVDPSKRFTIDQIKHHEWYTDQSVSAKPIGQAHKLNSGLSRNSSMKKLISSTENLPIVFGLNQADAEPPKTSPRDLTGSGVTVLTDPDVDLLDEISLVPTVNAFTLINMTGAFDLTRIFDGPTKKPFTLAHSTKFVWTQVTVAAAFQTLLDILSPKNISLKKNEKVGRFVIRAHSNLGTLRFFIQLYTMLEDAIFVEFIHMDGPEQSFYQYYKSLFTEIQPFIKASSLQSPSKAVNDSPEWLKSIPDLEGSRDIIIEDYP